ncbi:MAG: hypothetical protein OXH10_07980 [bacterium]|nr:hypothetical protein [bacterium]
MSGFLTRPSRGMVLALTWLVLAAVGCATDNEVVFDGSPDSPDTTTLLAEGAVTDTTALPLAAEVVTDTSLPPGAPSESEAPEPVTTIPTDDPSSTEEGEIDLSDRGIEALTAPLLVSGRLGSYVTVLGPGDTRTLLGAADNTFFSQPTWSPDGQTVAFSRATEEGGSVVVVPSSGGTGETYTAPFVVFYIQWSPDGRYLAMLGSGGVGRTSLAVLDLDTGLVEVPDYARSYFFQWAADSAHVLGNLDGAQLQVLDIPSGEIDQIYAQETVRSLYQAPDRVPGSDTAVYIRPVPNPEQEDTEDELVLHRLDTGEIRVIDTGVGFFDFGVSPDGTRLAYTLRFLNDPTRLRIVDLESGEVTEPDTGVTLAWQWSPDSEKILLIGIGEENNFTLSVYEDGATKSYPGFIPTQEMLAAYLPFWNQYTRSHTLWAPDSSAFAYPAFSQGDDYIFLQILEDDFPILLGEGGMAVFSPVG